MYVQFKLKTNKIRTIHNTKIKTKNWGFKCL